MLILILILLVLILTCRSAFPPFFFLSCVFGRLEHPLGGSWDSVDNRDSLSTYDKLASRHLGALIYFILTERSHKIKVQYHAAYKLRTWLSCQVGIF